MVAGAGLGASVLGGVTNLTSDTIAQNYALRKCKEADDKIKNDQERSANLERSETRLTNAIVFLTKEAEDSKTDITTIMKSASVTSKGMKVFSIVRNTVGFARAGYRGVGAVEWRLEEQLGKPVELSLLLGLV